MGATPGRRGRFARAGRARSEALRPVGRSLEDLLTGNRWDLVERRAETRPDRFSGREDRRVDAWS